MVDSMSNVPKLRFKEFSGEWDETSIGDVSKIFGRIGYRGYTVNDIVEKGQGAIALSPGNFVNNRLKLENSTYISWFKYEESPEIMIENGDILFVKTGSTFGKTAFVTSLDEKATINPQIVVLKEITMSNTLLSYIVTNTAIKKQVQKIVVGGAIPTMSQKELAKMQFYLPYLEEQTKIASFLTSVDTKIEQLTKKETLLQEYKKGVMNKIFNQGIRFKADDGSEFPEWEEKIIDKLPICISDGNYGELYPTSEDFKTTGIPFLRANNIKNLKIDDSDTKYISEKQHSTLTSGHLVTNDILITTRGELGNIALIDEKHNGSNINAQICLLRVTDKSKLYYLYLLYILDYRDSKKQYKAFETGTALKQLPKGNLKKIIIKIPCLEEQTKIANFLSSIDTKIELTTKELNGTKEYKKALLQQMFV